ncbi:MAG: V-type ATPase 116kDa subunit family protein [Gammaproteobacteria bacterium]|jgi:V/A-type H+-transporting ATPase subunit I
MSLRPVPARWFEIVVPRTSCVIALEALAATGEVELEMREGRQQSLRLDVMREQVAHYDKLTRRYQTWWPEPVFQRVGQEDLPPESVLDTALQHIEDWQVDADTSINTLESLRSQREECQFWREALTALHTAGIELSLLSRGEFLSVKCCCQLPEGSQPVYEDVLSLPFYTPTGACLLALVPGNREGVFMRGMSLAHAVCRDLPDWLQDVTDFEAQIAAREQAIAAEDAQYREQLADINQRHDMPSALGELERGKWLLQHVDNLPASAHLSWLTGWTTLENTEPLDKALEKAGVRGLVHFPPAPTDKSPPLRMRHSSWVRPFEVFTRALGIPGRDEADPSALLAVIVPLMFGYMFGDVGQGAVLAVAGLILQRRWPVARILVICGGAAVLFGALFGSVFSLENLLPPLWLHPLSDPLLLLEIPLIGGVLLLTLGIVINGFESRWRRPGGFAWVGDAGFLVIYWGLVGGFLNSGLFMLALLGLLVYLLGHAERGRMLASMLGALAHLIETTFQILINTLSFLRVGAFALAHAGLSSAVISLAETTGNRFGFVVILVIGNVLILAIEGLVVSIQTTRLVLFEFFVRFLQGTGRPFRPVPFPPSANRSDHVQKNS